MVLRREAAILRRAVAGEITMSAGAGRLMVHTAMKTIQISSGLADTVLRRKPE